MAKTITELTAASVPLAGTELAWIEQGGLPRKVAVSEFTDGDIAADLAALPAITPPTADADLFLIEQGGVSRKITKVQLENEIVPDGVTLDSTRRWTGSAWAASDVLRVRPSYVSVVTSGSGTPFGISGSRSGLYIASIDNTSTATGASASVSVECDDGALVMQTAGTNRVSALAVGGPTGLSAALMTTVSTQPLSIGTSTTERIRVEDVRTTFNTQIVAAASDAGTSSIRLPEGVAPSSPVNGDMWVTTTDILARVNGTSQSLLGGGLTELSEDTTPVLGGTLQANGWNIDMGTNVITDAKVATWDGLTSNVTHTSQVTGSGALTVQVAAITGQTATTVVANTDELLINDGGNLRRVDVVDIAKHMGLGDNSPSGGNTYLYLYRSNASSPPLYSRQAGAGPCARFFFSTTAGATSSTTDMFEVLNDGGANADGAVTDNLGSDRRIKNTITPIEDALEKIGQLNGVSFYYNEPVNGTYARHAEGLQYGFIAQDMQNVLPELVTTHETSGMLKIRRKGFEVCSLLVEGIKELKAEVDALKLLH